MVSTMAGFIAVNSENEFSMSSVIFDAIVNYSKLYLEEMSAELAHEIYEPIDEAGMFFMGLTESSSDDFNLIFVALQRGYESCLEQGKCGSLDQTLFSDVMNMWKNILVVMELDERQQVKRRS